MFDIHRVEIEWGGRKLKLETGHMARQADAAVYAQYGETSVLATVVGARSVKPGIDFFPLTVNYQERTYAAGKIPGGYFKREGRPSEKETLVSRLIDRPIRPLFVEGFKNEVQVVVTVLSHDLENDPDIVGMVAVGKPIEAFAPFIANARAKLLQVALISAGALLAAIAFALVWLLRPLRLVRDLWRALSQRGGGPLRARLRQMAHALRAALADVRDALAGTSYAEQYVQTLAHEIKSPLAAIRGAAELLREPMSEPARARFAGNIEEQVARAQDLVERMLELTTLERRGTLERVERVSLAQVVRLVVAEAAHIAERKRMRFEVDVPEPVLALGDAFLLQRAISNLVRNALDFAPVHSTVEITAREAGRQVELTVHDYGPGLPPFAQRRVFEKFFSTARPDTGKKGTGLGLAFVREVAALHGGTARLANHPEGGAVATLLLPRATEG